MTACVWSTSADKCALEFPALTLIRFMWNHHLLSTISERPPWLTVEGGAKRYIDAVMRECKEAHLHLSTPVKSLTRRDGRIELELGGEEAGNTETFDEVIMACHGDQARELLGSSATLDEEEILAAFETTPNTAYLHSDLSLMPKRRAAWSAWNYLTTSKSSSAQPPTSTESRSSGALQTVSLTYNMNILQAIPVSDFSDVLVTLNPEVPPSLSTTQAIYQYRHPLYNARMIAAQSQLEKIQGKRGVWYVGAWTGYGFHEDGFSSGMNVGLALGGNVPWTVRDAKFSRGVSPLLGWKDHLARTVIAVLQVLVRLFEKVFGASEGYTIPVIRNVNGMSNSVAAMKKKL
jgi:predicted NAD/FAD-binding protein